MQHLFNRILCPVDFSDYSTLALRYAGALAADYHAKLIVYHSVPDLQQLSSYVDGNYIDTVMDVLLTNGREKLREYASGSIPAGVEWSEEIGRANAPEGILEVASSERVDLIVMGTHGYSGYQKFLLGSVTNRVLHKCAIPVLAVCKPQHHFISNNPEHPISLRRILCALEFEPNSSKIAKTALTLARTYQSELIFLHVAKKTEGKDWYEKEKQSISELQKLTASDKNGCNTRFLVEGGEAAQEIVKAVERHGIDLVIMGHHTRKPVEEYLLGSVTKHVIPDCACPVLVVRSKLDLVYGD